MAFIQVGSKRYEVDPGGFLLDSAEWDEQYARAIAPELGIDEGLTEQHWAVLRFIRRAAAEGGRCPLVYQTCRANGLRASALEHLFPAGYLRGACKLAGITYRQAYHGSTFWAPPCAEGEQPAAASATEPAPVERPSPQKTYRIDVRGFLVDPDEWDEAFAAHRAHDLKMAELTERHWDILRYLRSCYVERGLVPTVYETCEHHGIDLDELEQLFPDGYHRGAVKLAGLRVI